MAAYEDSSDWLFGIPIYAAVGYLVYAALFGGYVPASAAAQASGSPAAAPLYYANTLTGAYSESPGLGSSDMLL